MFVKFSRQQHLTTLSTSQIPLISLIFEWINLQGCYLIIIKINNHLKITLVTMKNKTKATNSVAEPT